MTALNKQALLSTDKHANQHMLSRLIVEANSAELRDVAEAVEQYTDRLIAALEAAEKRIEVQREYFEGVIADGTKRIAELDSAPIDIREQRLASMATAYLNLQHLTEVYRCAYVEALARVAELESRTVSVKLPEIERPIDGTGYAAAAGERRYKERVIDVLVSAGIQVIEGGA